MPGVCLVNIVNGLYIFSCCKNAKVRTHQDLVGVLKRIVQLRRLVPLGITDLSQMMMMGSIELMIGFYLRA